MGWVVLDADLLSVVGAMFAVIAGLGLAVAAMTLVRKACAGDYDFAAGYNALAHTEH